MTDNNHRDPYAGTPLVPHDQFTALTLTRDMANPRVARITFNRPASLNAITFDTPGEIRRAVEAANADEATRVIVLQGAGPAFCAGYDIAMFAESEVNHPCKQESQPWDPSADYRAMRA
jgi:enoyl-CoA hydratase